MNGTAPSQLTLVSHALCPYVQRAAIVLAEKGVAFERRVVDLAAKPDWFLAVSPLGKTPVLLAGEVPIFESAVICEYLDETLAPRMHPADALQRAQHRSWIEFASAALADIAALYNAADERALAARRDALATRFERLEAALDELGPWFAGADFSLVDAAWAPVFRYFDVFETFTELRLFDATPKLRAWQRVLAQRASVRDSVGSDYPGRLLAFLRARGSAFAAKVPPAATSRPSAP